MGLHIGSSEELKITTAVGKVISTCKLIIPSIPPIINNIRLLSSDDFILQDSNGLYLIPKEVD